MNQSIVTGLFIARSAGAPMEMRDAVRAVAGRGLEGDRYFDEQGSFSRWPGRHRDVSLIAEEDLAAIEAESGIVLKPEDTRRNILTRGISLHDLINVEFWIGDVRLLGLRKCQPCKYLARLNDEPNLVRAMINRGGLRAHVVEGGEVKVGSWFTGSSPRTRLFDGMQQ